MRSSTSGPTLAATMDDNPGSHCHGHRSPYQDWRNNLDAFTAQSRYGYPRQDGYRTLIGDRVIAVLADSCMWRIQSIGSHGGVHSWSWTPAALAGNLWSVGSNTVIPAP